MPGHRLLVVQGRQQPVSSRTGIGHRLLGGKGFRGDDEQGLGRVEVAGRLEKIGAVDVGDEAEGQVAAAVMAQRLVGHDRAQVGTADADVDHVADRPAGVPPPGAAAHPFAKPGHPLQNGMDIRHDVAPLDADDFPAGGPQGDMQDRALFGGVDFVAPEHGRDPSCQIALFRQADQQLQCLLGDALLGKVAVETGRFDGQAFGPPRIVGKKLAQVQVLDRGEMFAQGLPGRQLLKSGLRIPGHRASLLTKGYGQKSAVEGKADYPPILALPAAGRA